MPQPLVAKRIRDRLGELERRGFSIPDHDKAAFYLDRIGWHRFCGYANPFEYALRRAPREITFDEILRLYRFDRELRLLCLNATERIEMCLKACLSEHLIDSYGHEWFRRDDAFPDWLSRPSIGAKQSKLQLNIINGYEKKLNNIPHRPSDDLAYTPDVMCSISLGQASQLYEMLDRDTQIEIANQFRKYSYDSPIFAITLRDWLKVISLIRNASAHHDILWNIRLKSAMNVPRFILNGFDQEWLKNSRWNELWRQRLYGCVVIIFYLLDRVSRAFSI